MPQHVAVQRVERGIVDVGREHAFAQVVEHDHSRDAAQPAKGLLMQFGPDLRTGSEHQQANRLAAVTQRQHEQPRAAILAAVRVADHGAGAVIDLGLFTGRGLDHRAGFRRRLAAELRRRSAGRSDSRRRSRSVHQILPDRHGVAATGEPQFDASRYGSQALGRADYGRAVVGAPAGRRPIQRQSRWSPLWPVLRTDRPVFAGLAAESVITSLAGFAGALPSPTTRRAQTQCPPLFR